MEANIWVALMLKEDLMEKENIYRPMAATTPEIG